MSTNANRRPSEQPPKSTLAIDTIGDNIPTPWGKAEIVYFLCVLIMYKIIAVAILSTNINLKILIPIDIFLLSCCTIILRYYILRKIKDAWSFLLKSKQNIIHNIIAIFFGLTSGLFFIISDILDNVEHYIPFTTYEFIVLILGVTIIPYIEEIYYRGFIYKGLKNDHNILLSMLISSILFLLFHFPFLNISIFILSILATLQYEISKSLTGSFLVHSTSNFTLYLYQIICIYF